MKLYSVLTIPDPRLRKKAEEVGVIDSNQFHGWVQMFDDPAGWRDRDRRLGFPWVRNYGVTTVTVVDDMLERQDRAGS